MLGNYSGYDTQIKENSEFLKTTTFTDTRNENGENLKITAHKKYNLENITKKQFLPNKVESTQQFPVKSL